MTSALDATEEQREVCDECGRDEAHRARVGEEPSVDAWPISMTPRSRMDRLVARVRRSVEEYGALSEDDLRDLAASFPDLFDDGPAVDDDAELIENHDRLTDGQRDVAAVLWSEGMTLSNAVKAAKHL